MSERFLVEAQSPMFRHLEDVQVVFHGINKSGSWSMAKVMGEGLSYVNRDLDYICHYGTRYSEEEFQAIVDRRTGRSFAVGHKLYGNLKPSPHRIWVTQFRHPLPRVVSVYSWLKKKHVRMSGSEEGFPALVDFVRDGRGVSHSQIAQFGLNGSNFRARLAKRLEPRDIYELAVDALEQEFYAIGIAERFEESIFVFAKLCCLDSIRPWEQDKRNKKRPLVDTLLKEEIDAINDVCKWDFELYKYAIKRFEEQIGKIKFGDSLENYKRACSDQYRDRM